MATLSSAQKAALAKGRAKLAKMRASGQAPKKKTSKKPSRRSAPKAASKPRSRKSKGKRKATPAQLAALAKGRAARAAKAKSASKPRARKAPAKRKTATPKKRPNRVATARKSIARAQRALAPRPRARKPLKPGQKRKPAPKSITSGSYSNKKGQTIIVRRTYNRKNPVVEFKQIALAGGGLAVGWIAAEMIDRYVATRAPKPAVEGQETKPLWGQDAIDAITAPADGTRLLVSGGGTAAFGLGAFLLRDRAPDVAYAIGGIGAGFGVKFFSQLLGDVIFPAIFKVKKDAEGYPETFANRMFPDKQKKEEPAATNGGVTGPRRMAGWGNWGAQRRVFYPGTTGQVRSPYPGVMGAPYPFVEAPAARTQVGPVASGAVAASCGGSSMGASMRDIFSPKGCGCGPTPGGVKPSDGWGGGCQSCGQPPAPVPVPVDDGTGNGNGEEWVNPYGDMSIAEQPPMPDMQLVEQTPPSVNIIPPEVVRAARGLMGSPAEQAEQASEQAAPAPATPGPTMSGTASVMAMMNRRRRR